MSVFYAVKPMPTASGSIAVDCAMMSKFPGPSERAVMP